MYSINPNFFVLAFAVVPILKMNHPANSHLGQTSDLVKTETSVTIVRIQLPILGLLSLRSQVNL